MAPNQYSIVLHRPYSQYDQHKIFKKNIYIYTYTEIYLMYMIQTVTIITIPIPVPRLSSCSFFNKSLLQIYTHKKKTLIPQPLGSTVVSSEY